MKIISYNVNGIRAAITKGFLEWLQQANPDIICLQETKATVEQVKEAVTIIAGRFETEASGGIQLHNIQAYAATGVDYVSVGGLIHQAQSLDLSLKAVK